MPRMRQPCRARSGREDRQGGVDALHRRLDLPGAGRGAAQAFRRRDAFDIEGFGGVYIETLSRERAVEEPADIFALAKKPDALDRALAERRQELSAERRAKDGKRARNKRTTRRKLVENLVAAIDARRKIALDRFINALGIRHVGETNARLIARNYPARCFRRGDGKQGCAVEELDAIGGIGLMWWRKRSRISSTSRTIARPSITF